MQYTFMCNDSKITTSISIIKELAVLIDKAYQLLLQIKGKIILTYFGKDLESLENMQIGQVFKDKKNITLIIVAQRSLKNEMSSNN